MQVTSVTEVVRLSYEKMNIVIKEVAKNEEGELKFRELVGMDDRNWAILCQNSVIIFGWSQLAIVCATRRTHRAFPNENMLASV